MSKYTSELECAKALIAAALAKGYFITVHADDEEQVLFRCRDEAEILAELNSSGIDGLRFYASTEESTKQVGWMLLVWGNDEHGRELIANYTDNAAMQALVDEVDADSDEVGHV